MKNKGFTLIEILVVVAIIGILSSVILVGLNGARKQGRDARRIADLRQIQTGLELYFMSKSEYPPNSNWATLKSNLIGAGIGISNVPDDPINGWSYGYCTPPGDSSQYTLGAYLEDIGNSALKQSITVKCNPPVQGLGGANPDCSQNGSTNKYCQTL